MLGTQVLQIIALATAHLVADFPLQSDRMVRAKRQGPLWLAWLHALVQGLLAGAAIAPFASWQAVAVAALAIFIAHGSIDLTVKRLLVPESVERDAERWRRKLLAFGLDQALHLAAIVGVVIFIARAGFDRTPAWGLCHDPGACAQWMICVAGFVIAVWMGGTVIGIRVEPFLAQLNPPDKGGLRTSLPRGFPGAGRLIGILERFLIFLFVLRGQYTAVAFLITAKSVLRFGEIKAASAGPDADSRKEPEYILIGTLLSVSWAISAAMLTLLAVAAAPAWVAPAVPAVVPAAMPASPPATAPATRPAATLNLSTQPANP